ncbi:hypothetical protein PGT21_033151 [Puccinia graminis f. sp. tritici]|uniref:Uncharacterized protein n=1 Tax=Puccinia graminis f. sp. tritici TaxID=56615 RepID=A0A5B0QCB9_PUCGR|nr:hypothetical protein PGT21_033151 [Puccinia graminis f. sp. tritici]
MSFTVLKSLESAQVELPDEILQDRTALPQQMMRKQTSSRSPSKKVNGVELEPFGKTNSKSVMGQFQWTPEYSKS